MNEDIVIVGGADKTGRRIAARLRAAGVAHRLASRSTAPAFDWADEATWPAALAGARAAYVVYAPDLSDPRAAERIGRLGEALLAAQVFSEDVLTGDGHAGATYELTGPKPVTFGQAAAAIAAATGRPVAFESPSVEDWRAGVLASGVPADAA